MTEQHLTSRMDFEGTPYAARIERLQGNSLSFDPARLSGTCDLVFVDGGHDLDTLKADTESPFKLICKGGMIFWHDYGNASYPKLSAVLKDVATVHIQEAMLCFL